MITVYWMMCGDKTIHSSNLVKVVKGEAIFDDGGHNRIEDCFLTEEQCRKHHNLPSQEWLDTRDLVARKLQKLLEELDSPDSKE